MRLLHISERTGLGEPAMSEKLTEAQAKALMAIESGAIKSSTDILLVYRMRGAKRMADLIWQAHDSGLAVIPAITDKKWRRVTLTDAGRASLARHRGETE